MSTNKVNVIDCLYCDLPKRDSNIHYEKIKDCNFIIPQEDEYNFIVCKNYRVSQLKEICRKYRLKISGNKEQLKHRIYNYLRLSVKARILQRIFKLNYLKIYNSKHGPARFNRKICVNETDFYSMDDLADIKYENFYSFKDDENKIYGFDVLSLFKMASRSNEILNPYNRKVIPNYVIKDIKFLIKKNNIYLKLSGGGEKIDLQECEHQQLSEQQRIELRALDIFQKMDMLGNYTNTDWFLSLERPAIIKFIRQLADIWFYRAGLTQVKQREICPPYGDPFRMINLYALSAIPTTTLQRVSLTVMEKLVVSGIDQDCKYLGSNYVLCALTLVNSNAATSLPWLYESVIEQPYDS